MHSTGSVSTADTKHCLGVGFREFQFATRRQTAPPPAKSPSVENHGIANAAVVCQAVPSERFVSTNVCWGLASNDHC